MKLLQRQAKRIVRTISPRLLESDDVQHLLWIPGIGRINAFSIHLEVGDTTRFHSVKPLPLLRPPGARGQELRPEMRVLFVSGYTDGEIVRGGELEPGTDFLQKPFTREQLAVKVREVLRQGHIA